MVEGGRRGGSLDFPLLKALLFSGLALFARCAHAQSVDSIPYRAVLLAQNEIGPGPVADLSARGAATVWVHAIRNAAGKVVSGSLDFAVSYKFSRPANIIGMRIQDTFLFGMAGSAAVTVPAGVVDPSGAGTLPARQVQFSNTDSDPTAFNTAIGLLTDSGSYAFNLITADSPSGAMRGQLQRAEVGIWMSLMSPARALPPVLGLNASATATVMALRTVDGTGAITSAYAIFDVNYNGLPSDTVFTALHLRLGTDATQGPLTVDSGLTGPVPTGGGGAGNLHSEAEVDLTLPQAIETLSALFQNQGGVYVNVQTQTSPSGVARGQLRRTDHQVFQLNLDPKQEIFPPVLGIYQLASAPAAIHVYTLRNADGSIPAGAMIFDVNPRFPAGTAFSGLHLRGAPIGSVGNVSVDSRLAAFPVLVPDAGSGNVWRLATVDSSLGVGALNDLIQNPENHYVNLNTVQYPGGGARSQLAGAITTAPVLSAAISAVSDPTRTLGANLALMSVYGTNLAKVATNLDGFPPLNALPLAINGTSVTVGGLPAPLQEVALDHVVIQVPAETPVGPQSVVVRNVNGPSQALIIPVQTAAPNLFFDAVGGSVLKTPEYSLLRPDNAATAGDVLIIYSTGLGQTSGPLNTGRIVPAQPYFYTQPVTVTIGGLDAPVIYSIASPGFAGLYQTAVQMPAGVPPGPVSMQMTEAGAASNVVTIFAK